MTASKERDESRKSGEEEAVSGGPDGAVGVPRDEDFYGKLLEDPMRVVDLYARPEDRDVCEPLVRALEDTDELVRRAAVMDLVALNDLYAASSIFWTAVHGSVAARRAAVEVLGRIGAGDHLAITHLFHALSDSDASVRQAGAEALKKLGFSIDGR